MNQRTVFRCILLLAVIFVVVAVLSALGINAGAPTDPRETVGPRYATHPFDESFSDCRACHTIGGENSMPLSHSKFSTRTCTTCHQPEKMI